MAERRCGVTSSRCSRASATHPRNDTHAPATRTSSSCTPSPRPRWRRWRERRARDVFNAVRPSPKRLGNDGDDDRLDAVQDRDCRGQRAEPHVRPRDRADDQRGGKDEHAPATTSPGQPRAREPMWMASSVEFGPGNQVRGAEEVEELLAREPARAGARPRPPSSRCARPARRTPVVPSLRKSVASSRSRSAITAPPTPPLRSTARSTAPTSSEDAPQSNRPRDRCRRASRRTSPS